MVEGTRDKLLSAAMGHVSQTGLADFSLRSVAGAIGTSHRMLSHYFGSKAGLEAAIVKRATELMTAPLLAAESANTNLTATERVQEIWEALTDPAIEPLIRLYFDLTNRAATGDAVATEAVDTIRDHWTRTALSLGNEPEDTEERLIGAAVTSTFLKGLLIDHLSGATIVETTATLGRFTDLIEAYEAIDAGKRRRQSGE